VKAYPGRSHTLDEQDLGQEEQRTASGLVQYNSGMSPARQRGIDYITEVNDVST